MGAATLDLGLMADESCFPGPLAQVVYHVEWRKSSHLFSLWILRLKRYIEALSDLVEELEFRDVQTFWPNSSPQPHHG